jgi:hypothetical protein
MTVHSEEPFNIPSFLRMPPAQWLKIELEGTRLLETMS